MRWGAGLERSTSSTDVWSGYKGVWHFNEGTVGPYKSSGSTANDAKTVNGALATFSGPAKVGNGVTFEQCGTKKAIALEANKVTLSSAGGPVTLSGWWQLNKVRRDSADTYPKLFTIGGWNSGGYYMQCGDDETWATGIDGTHGHAFRCIRDIIPHFEKRGKGVIVNVCSMYSLVAPDFAIYGTDIPWNPPSYGAGKAGLQQLTRYSANALGGEIIRAFAAPINGFPNARGGIFIASGHSARQFIDLGLKTAATPDGRRKGEEFSKNISPAPTSGGARACRNDASCRDAAFVRLRLHLRL